MDRNSFTLTIEGRCYPTANSIDVINPANGRVFAQAPAAGLVEVEAAVDAAARAQMLWARRDWADRASHLVRIAEVLEAHIDALAKIETAEQGKPLASARQEIFQAALRCRDTAKMTLEPEVAETNEHHKVFVHHPPLGVVAAIIPWNFPVLLAFVKIAPALLVGNTVVLKPAPSTPLTTLKICELLREILPPGVLNVVSGDDALGPMITSHRSIDKITFTGSTATGKRVMECAAKNLVGLTLELGGNDAGIVMPDVNVPAIAEALFWSAFNNSSQVCIAVKRMFVHTSIYDEVKAALIDVAGRMKMGDGTQEGVRLGPIQNRPQYERVKTLIAETIAAGHRLALGGQVEDGEGFFIPVTIFDNPPDDSRVVREEAFGPVLPLLRFDEIDEVVERANASEFGLGGAIWCADEAMALDIASRLNTGTVWINEVQNINAAIPFFGTSSLWFGSRGRQGWFA